MMKLAFFTLTLFAFSHCKSTDRQTGQGSDVKAAGLKSDEITQGCYSVRSTSGYSYSEFSSLGPVELGFDAEEVCIFKDKTVGNWGLVLKTLSTRSGRERTGGYGIKTITKTHPECRSGQICRSFTLDVTSNDKSHHSVPVYFTSMALDTHNVPYKWQIKIVGNPSESNTFILELNDDEY